MQSSVQAKHWALPSSFMDLSAFGKVQVSSGAPLCFVEQQGRNESVIRVDYKKGSTGPSSAPHGGCNFYATPPLDLKRAKEYWLEYQVYFPRSFDFALSGKLPGMEGGGQGCGGGNDASHCWSSRMAWRGTVPTVQRRDSEPIAEIDEDESEAGSDDELERRESSSHPQKEHKKHKKHRKHPKAPKHGKEVKQASKSSTNNGSQSGVQTSAKANTLSVSSQASAHDHHKNVGELYMYLPRKKQLASICKVPPYFYCNPDFGMSMGRGAFSYALDDWTTVRQKIRISSSPSAHDGGIELVIDGKSVMKYEEIAYPTVTDLLVFSSFFGGSGPEYASPKDQSAYFRKFSIQVTEWGNEAFGIKKRDVEKRSNSASDAREAPRGPKLVGVLAIGIMLPMLVLTIS